MAASSPSVEVDREHAQPLGRRHVHAALACAPPADPRVDEARVDAAQRLHRLRERAVDGGLVGDVAVLHEHAAAGPGQRGRGRAVLLRVRAPDRHRRARAAASASAMPSPMPLLPPVINATLPVRSNPG